VLLNIQGSPRAAAAKLVQAPTVSAALVELMSVWTLAELRPQDVRDMKRFGRCSGARTSTCR